MSETVTAFPILYCDPTQPPSQDPVLDELSQRYHRFHLQYLHNSRDKAACYACRSTQSQVGTFFQSNRTFALGLFTNGFHRCRGCALVKQPVFSDDHEHLVHSVYACHTLGYHYLLFHRREISPEQIQSVNKMLNHIEKEHA